MDSGEFRRDADPEVAARVIVSGLMLQAALQVHSDLEDLAPCDVDRIFDSSVELLLRGLVAGAMAPSEAWSGGGGLRPIGRVENRFDDPADPDTIAAAGSRIVVAPELVPALQGLAAGDRVLVLFRFHRSDAGPLQQHPRSDKTRPKRGFFALRSPHRPNRIGATVVELLAVDGNVLEVRGLDAINGTPVLDLKPA